jgi:hypothetical protein
MEKIMMQIDLPLEEVIKQLRKILPADTATARAIDQHEPWDLIAIRAINDEYIDSAHDLAEFVETCLRRSAC